MLNTTISWVGSGLALALVYILVSNTLWLLFGSRVLQYMPGVNIKGIAGTLKIASMIVLSALGTIIWVFKYIYFLLVSKKAKPVFKDEVSKTIQLGALIIESRR